MAYNKAREERKWRIWKQSEEKKLRELGVSDDNISRKYSISGSCDGLDNRFSSCFLLSSQSRDITTQICRGGPIFSESAG